MSLNKYNGGIEGESNSSIKHVSETRKKDLS